VGKTHFQNMETFCPSDAVHLMASIASCLVDRAKWELVGGL
jgi:hypothetical protein